MLLNEPNFATAKKHEALQRQRSIATAMQTQQKYVVPTAMAITKIK